LGRAFLSLSFSPPFFTSNRPSLIGPIYGRPLQYFLAFLALKNPLVSPLKHSLVMANVYEFFANHHLEPPSTSQPWHELGKLYLRVLEEADVPEPAKLLHDLNPYFRQYLVLLTLLSHIDAPTDVYERASAQSQLALQRMDDTLEFLEAPGRAKAVLREKLRDIYEGMMLAKARRR
jgi:hypothetical protein